MATSKGADFASVPDEVERVGSEVVDAAVLVHTELGPGLLESLYDLAIAHELDLRDLQVETEAPVPSRYRDVDFDGHFRLDLLLEDAVVVEVKAVEDLRPVHEAQVRTYLQLTENRSGFLLNFNVPPMKDGLNRLVL